MKSLFVQLPEVSRMVVVNKENHHLSYQLLLQLAVQL